jgi:endonuclease YncB( thermonuclease family)
MINALGNEVDPNGHPGEQQQQQARKAKKGVFTEAEMEALRQLASRGDQHP